MDLTTSDIKVQNEVQVPEPAKVSANKRVRTTNEEHNDTYMAFQLVL